MTYYRKKSGFTHTPKFGVTPKRGGFTLIELLVVVAIIGILASVVLASLNTARGKARNARRLSEVHQLQNALDMYYNQFGVYPDPSSDSGAFACGGWDATADGNFISSLITNGFFPSVINDTADSVCGNFAYYRYPSGYASCPIDRGAFYILGIRTMDSGGFLASPGFSCSGRDWQAEFQWVTGRFEQ